MGGKQSATARFGARLVIFIALICALLSPALRASEFLDGASSDAAALGDGPARSEKIDTWSFEEPEFLTVDEAFVLSTQVAEDGSVLVSWDIEDGYYLYRHRFNFSSRIDAERPDSPVTFVEAEIPPGKKKFDEWFGDVEVYYGSAQARVPVAKGAGPVEVGIGFQGCADAGLCYPPEVKWVALTVGQPGSDGGSAGGGIMAAAAPTSIVPQTEEQALAATLASGGLLTALLLFFLGGIALAFTPCVLPMVPILSSIIVGESENLSRSRAFTLSLAYVLGMAVTYAFLGVLVGLFGASLNLQAALQSPGVLIFFALVFAVLSLSMFGFYELQLPASWQNRLNAMGDKVGGGCGPDEQHHPIDKAESTARFPELTPALAGREIEGAEIHTTADRQRRPERKGSRRREHPLEEPDGHRQQTNAEDGLHGVHPGTGPGQQVAAAGTDH